jgi:hypothetical protein
VSSFVAMGYHLDIQEEAWSALAKGFRITVLLLGPSLELLDIGYPSCILIWRLCFCYFYWIAGGGYTSFMVVAQGQIMSDDRRPMVSKTPGSSVYPPIEELRLSILGPKARRERKMSTVQYTQRHG